MIAHWPTGGNVDHLAGRQRRGGGQAGEISCKGQARGKWSKHPPEKAKHSSIHRLQRVPRVCNWRERYSRNRAVVQQVLAGNSRQRAVVPFVPKFMLHIYAPSQKVTRMGYVYSIIEYRTMMTDDGTAVVVDSPEKTQNNNAVPVYICMSHHVS